VASCNGDSVAARASDVDITIWHGFESEEMPFFREIVKDFEKEYSDKLGRPVKVELSYTPFPQMETKLKTATLAHQTPDLCFVDIFKVLNLAYGKALVPLDELEAFKKMYPDREAMASEYVRAAFDTNVINVQGKTNLYGVPAQTTCVALFYNRALFRRFNDQLVQAGLDPQRAPETWDELMKYATAMTSKDEGLFGFAMHKSLWWSYPYINSYRSAMIRYEDNGRALPAFNDQRAEAVLKLMQDLATGGFEGGAWRQGGLSPEQGFLDGKYAMCINGPWKVADWLGAGVDFGIAPIPKLSKAEAQRVGLLDAQATDEDYERIIASSSNLGGQDLVMFRTAPNKDLAFEFMVWFTSDKIQRRWCTKLTQIPVRLSAMENLEMKNREYFDIFMNQLRTTLVPPLMPLVGLLEVDIFNKELDLLLDGKKTPAQMAQAVCAQMDEMILTKMNAFLD